MYENRIKGSMIRCEYDSLAQYADAAGRRHTGLASNTRPTDETWCLGVDFPDALALARKGWTDQVEPALEVAETAILMAEKEHMVDSFSQPVWDVTGAQVDVGAYLAGTPECMIDYPLSETSKVGRVVTLVASVAISAAISSDTIVRRGQLIVALALALSRLGHATEVWASNHSTNDSKHAEIRVKVKGADDEIDPGALMFAFAHPAMLRRLTFAVKEGFPGAWENGRMGHPEPPTTEGMPEGTIFLPELRSSYDVPEADEFLREHLGNLGLLAE